MESIALSPVQRRLIISQIITTVQSKFYDPSLHGADLTRAFELRMREIMECPASAFAQEVETTLSALRASPLKFYERSKQRTAARWAIRSTFRRRDKNSVVCFMFQDVMPGGQAHGAGFETGDILINVNSEAPVHEPAFPIGHSELVVEKRDGRLRRETVVVPSRAPMRAVFHSKFDSSIGYLRLTHMPGLVGVDLARDTDAAIAELNDCQRLIVDLRGNPGGGTGGLRLMSYLTPKKIPVGHSLTRVRAEAGYDRKKLTKFRRIPSQKWILPLLALKYKFIDHSVVVVTEGMGRRRFHGRVVLLVNEHSISGAEIIAGFAADHGLATIVGTATAGTLLGWRSFPMDFGFVLVIPTGNYLTWEGKSFEGIGVQPHVQIDFDTEAALQGQDVQLQRAIEVVSSL